MRKKWWEYSDEQKRNIENYIEMKRRQAKAYQKAKVKRQRLNRKNKIKRIEKNRQKKNDKYALSVSVIHWVKDTPHSLALQFLEWKTKR